MASKRRLRRNACENKRRYTSREEAQLAARRHYWLDRLGLHPYQCAFCRQWHLGHQSGMGAVRTDIRLKRMEARR